jgi:uncharacterized membrane protein (UPF0127 family)
MSYPRQRPGRLHASRLGLAGSHAMNSQTDCLMVTNQTMNTVLCPAAAVADTALTRLFGLLGRSPLAPEEGLLIKPSSGVHTWGMTFPIDIVALSRDNCVLGVWNSVGPWRVRGLGFKTRSILELSPGAIRRSATSIGDRLLIAHVVPNGGN